MKLLAGRPTDAGALPLARRLDALSDDDLAETGGKASSLGVLHRAGFAVPDAVVLTVEAFRRFVEASGLASELDALGARLETGDLPLDASWAPLADLRARIEAAPFPDDVRQALAKEGAALLKGDAALAVRSSGTKEDLEGTSFAGQYETVLGVRGAAGVEHAVKRCWSSILKTRVLVYASRRAGGASGLGMAVVVQRLITSEVSGVIFTVNPVSGRENEAVIESVFGLGEALVGGKVNADRFVVDTRTQEVLERAIAEKRLKIVPSRQDGATTAEVELAGAAAKAPTLDDARLLELAELAAAIQEHYGQPMDVEWALAAGKVHVLQARPITKLSFAPDTGEWTTADFRDGGVSSDVCSPFMWSLYESVLEHTLPGYFKQLKLLPADHHAKWTRSFFARPYWNMGEVKRTLEQLPGYCERDFDEGLGVKPSYEGRGKTTPVSAGGVLRALPVLFALKRTYREQLAEDARFRAAFEDERKTWDLAPDALARLDAQAFAERFAKLIRDFYFRTESTYFLTIYNTSNSKTDFKDAFDTARAACKGDLDYLRLMGGLEDLSHLRPIRDLHERLGKLRAEGKEPDQALVRDFAHRWRFHGRKELDIRVPRWRDDLPFVEELVREAWRAFDPSRGPVVQAHAQREVFDKELAKARAALWWRPFARRAFEARLAQLRTYAWWREEMRDLSTKAYDVVRLWTVEAARRLVADRTLEEPDDVWYLRFPDAIELVEGSLAKDVARRLVRAGRRLCRSFRSFDAPGEIGQSHGFAAPTGAPPAEGALRGLGCSPGRVEATARVVRKLEEAPKVKKGEVLVTIFTDPGWTPLLGRVGAVVTETGGMLSHAAVISREYGIPAVLAVAGATQQVKDGDVVIVDGTAGTVEVKRA